MDTFYRDPRIEKNVFTESPTLTILICLAYVIFVKILGPAWMSKKKPYDLKVWLILHNFILVVASGWIFYKLGRHGWFGKYSWICENIDYRITEDSLALIKISELFFYSKFLEMLDTVFFVLRKKNSHISFLHVVHHGLVPILLWFGGGRAVSGFNTLFAFLNSFVHIWMYLYYGLAAFGPSVQKYLWWKKYLTTLQMFQFCLLSAATVSVIVTPGCNIPWSIIAYNLLSSLMFLGLFANFYRNAYKPKRITKSSENGALRKTENLNGDIGKVNNGLLLHND